MKTILPATAIAIAICVGAAQPASAQSIKRSDFLSSDQIKQASGGYKLKVPGVGTVAVLSADASGKTCLVRRDSLIQMISAKPPTSAGPAYVHIKSHEMSDGSLGCWGPGAGCRVLVVGPPPAPNP